MGNLFTHVETVVFMIDFSRVSGDITLGKACEVFEYFKSVSIHDREMRKLIIVMLRRQ